MEYGALVGREGHISTEKSGKVLVAQCCKYLCHGRNGRLHSFDAAAGLPKTFSCALGAPVLPFKIQILPSLENLQSFTPLLQSLHIFALCRIVQVAVMESKCRQLQQSQPCCPPQVCQQRLHTAAHGNGCESIRRWWTASPSPMTCPYGSPEGQVPQSEEYQSVDCASTGGPHVSNTSSYGFTNQTVRRPAIHCQKRALAACAKSFWTRHAWQFPNPTSMQRKEDKISNLD